MSPRYRKRHRRTDDASALQHAVDERMDLPLDYGRVRDALDTNALMTEWRSRKAPSSATVEKTFSCAILARHRRMLPGLSAVLATLILTMGIFGVGVWIANRSPEPPIPPVFPETDTIAYTPPTTEGSTGDPPLPETHPPDTCPPETTAATGFEGPSRQPHETDPGEEDAPLCVIFGSVIYHKTDRRIPLESLGDRKLTSPLSSGPANSVACYTIRQLDPSRYVAVSVGGYYLLYKAETAAYPDAFEAETP